MKTRGLGWRRGTVYAVVAAGLTALPSDVVNARGELTDLPHLLDNWSQYHGGPAPLYAIREPYIFTHNVGLLQLQITNIGMIGNYFIDTFSAGWRGGEYLYGAGLWIGARDDNGIPHVTTAIYDTEFLPSQEQEWTVYEAFEGITNGNRVGFSTPPEDEVAPGTGIGDIVSSGANDDRATGDGRLDEDFLNGLDDDGDGLVDEDYEAVSQQMFSTQYWDIEDATQQQLPDHVPLNLLVQQRSFAWATQGANEFIGLDFRIRNQGNETLNDVFIAFFVDGDVGPKDTPQFWVDDKGGFVHRDTTFVDESVDAVDAVCQTKDVSFDIAYMFDVPDIEITEEDAVRGGDVPGYLGGMFLGHTIDPLGLTAPDQVGIRRAQFFSSADPYPEGDPRNDIERYDLISGQGVPQRETSKPADYRYVISAGPFESLPPDTFLTFQTAFVVGQGKDGMIDNAIGAQLIFDGVWRNADLSDDTGEGGRETCIRPPGTAGSVEYVSPCDTTGTSIRIDWPGYCAPSTYVDDDCEACTPLATRTEPGPETRVNWVGTVAPAPPATNTDGGSVSVSPGGNRRVVLQWDNLSELKADPIQRRILFEGYRIWRVEGWNRPVGSTGPAPEEWQKIAEFVRHPLMPPNICRVQDPEIANATISFAFSADYLGNWDPVDPRNALPDDPCEACPQFCWPNRPFYVDDTVDTLEVVATGDTTPGFGTAERYDVGRYTFVDDSGIKNGMIYFYDVTAFSAWDEVTVNAQGDTTGVRHFELSGRPAAREQQRVVPTWPAQDSKDEIYVVPNPYVQSDRTVLPWGWDLIPSNSDPTGTRIAFTNLPIGRNVIKIYTLAGDLVETIETRSTGENGTAFWNLVSRNGQDVTAGVYLYTVKTESRGVKVGRFVVVR